MRVDIKSKKFGSHEVLRDVDFEVPEGRVLAVLGPSGVGKTTLLRILAGLDRDFVGTAASAGAIGMVFQEPRLLPWLTARENVALVAPENGWLARLGLSGFENHFPRQLSLGMARRVALARALAIRPTLLILDEPFASLDDATARDLKTLLKNLQREAPVTTIFVSHSAEDAAELAHRAIFLGGKPAGVVAQLALPGSPDDRDSIERAVAARQLRLM